MRACVRVRMRVRACVRARACVSACVCVRVRASVSACGRAHACVVYDKCSMIHIILRCNVYLLVDKRCVLPLVGEIPRHIGNGRYYCCS